MKCLFLRNMEPLTRHFPGSFTYFILVSCSRRYAHIRYFRCSVIFAFHWCLHYNLIVIWLVCHSVAYYECGKMLIKLCCRSMCVSLLLFWLYEIQAYSHKSTCETQRQLDKVPSDMSVLLRFWSACAFAQSDQNLHMTHFEMPRMHCFFTWTTKTKTKLREYAGWLSLRLAHMWEGKFCHVETHVLNNFLQTVIET